MLKVIDKKTALALIALLAKCEDFTAARAALAEYGIENGTTVKKEAFPFIPSILDYLYNSADKGKNGKISEVEERLSRWYENGRPLCRWFELHARRHGKSDMSGKSEEMKTGAGDWLYSTVYSDRENIVSEYRKRNSLIFWKTDYFTIRCSWSELLAYMDTYNGKGAEQFFKVNVKYNPMIERSVVMLQEWKTSKKKIAFFQACPYNED